MFLVRAALSIVVSVGLAAVAFAQSSYPMLMSLKPVATQVGQTTEHTLEARYDMFGAYKVIVSGEGVTGEVATPMAVKEGEKKPVLTKIQLKFTVAADALPGVRDVRIATPNGVSTVAQLVVGTNPVVYETAGNDTADKAQAIAVPATVCGCIEKAEDVDFFKFKVEAGAALSFHVRSQRLENRIHDLQNHSDPLLAIRNAQGSTLAEVNNYYAGDPFLHYKFEQAGEYLLEIRDVRYQGNQYWEYSIEITSGPYVSGVYPMGVPRGQDSTVRLIGHGLPADPTAVVSIPSDALTGPRWTRLARWQSLNTAPIVVSALPLVMEAEGDNNTVEKAQPVTLPCGVNGRIETESDIDVYAFEAKKGDLVAIEVFARRQQSPLDSLVRIVGDKGQVYVENDDARFGRLTWNDSWIETWTAPADGKFFLEIRDQHLRGGDDFVYFLEMTRPEPYFQLEVDTDKTLLTPGTCGPIFVRAVRKHGFNGEVQLKIDGLPEGVTASCGRILTGKSQDGLIVLEAAGDAPLSAANVLISGTGTHKFSEEKSAELSAVATPLQEIYMPGGGRSHYPVEQHTVSVGAPNDIRAVNLSTHEIKLKPGDSQKIEIDIVRGEGFDKNIGIELTYQHLGTIFGDSLPTGVTVDGKNSKTLLSGKETKAFVTLTAAKDAVPVEKQQVCVMANISINFVMKTTYCSRPVLVTVEKPAP